MTPGPAKLRAEAALKRQQAADLEDQADGLRERFVRRLRMQVADCEKKAETLRLEADDLEARALYLREELNAGGA